MELKVDRIPRRLAGESLAVVPPDVAEQLGFNRRGPNVLRVEGEEGVAYCRGRSDGRRKLGGTKWVKIDGVTRDEIGAEIGRKIEVTREENVPEAERVILSYPERLRIKGDASRYVKKRLIDSGQPVYSGAPVSFSLVGPRKTMFNVESLEPSEVALVGRETEVEVVRGSKNLSQSTKHGVKYEDIGGLDEELEQVREMVELPMRHPELFQQLGIDPPKGVLLHGPPGTGKTLMARAVSNEIDAHFESISGPEIMSKYYGESEEQLREVFERAEENAPSVIFMDELDSIAPKRGEASGDVERRVVAQLLSLMDGLEERGEVVVIGATNRVDSIDPALRRGGRFDREVEVGVPDKEGRKEVLQIHTRGMPISDEVELEEIAESTHGFVGADLESLSKEAAMTALRRVRPEFDMEEDTLDADLLESIEIEMGDFRSSLREIEPSALREVFVETPDTTWSSVGGLKETKERLRETVQWPLDHADVFEHMDIEAAKGVLLYGPPGTGKTLLAKAIANESQSNFISVKGPELLNKFVGESEKGVREVFSKARENAPTVVFFDEIDSIAAERGQNVGDSGVGERVVSQLLTELDGLEKLEDVVVIATSNRPDLIDNALLRPGRLDRHIHVPVPDADAREQIFEVHTRNKPIADDVDLGYLATNTEGYVGADIQAVCREASLSASREYLNSESDTDLEELEITSDHFEEALSEVGPSVTEERKERYEEVEEKLERAEDNPTTTRTFQ